MDEDKVIKKLAEHDQRFDELVTKSEFREFKNSFLHTQDEIMTILRRLDEERVFTAAWIQRIEKENATIKAHLKIN